MSKSLFVYIHTYVAPTTKLQLKVVDLTLQRLSELSNVSFYIKTESS